MTYSLGRNDLCICGSKKKFKKCCMNKPNFKLEDFAEQLKERERKENSSLKSHDLKAGEGKEASSGDSLSMHYTGWLYDEKAKGKKGNKFDSSLDRGETFDFALGGGMVISGWDEGILGMKAGGKRRLIIPPEMGYGEHGSGGGIPGNSTLLFEVELVSIS
jgi:FKBP-type peptidyl-prolyl cis-trans isomerase FkpA